MTSTTANDNAARRMSLSQKLALASGAGAALAGIVAQQSADAAPIQSTTLPVSPPAADGRITWDIDGDGTADFNLSNDSSSSASLSGVYGNPNNRVVGVFQGAAPFDILAKLSSGFAVGGALATGYFFNSQAAVNITSSGAAAADVARGGWAIGDVGYFGFRFSNAGGVHYGWGQLDLHGTAGGFLEGQGFTITDAYYESTPGASIAVGDTGASAVPEIDPASAGSVMSLVIGSLAMLERRRKLRGSAA